MGTMTREEWLAERRTGIGGSSLDPSHHTRGSAVDPSHHTHQAPLWTPHTTHTRLRCGPSHHTRGSAVDPSHHTRGSAVDPHPGHLVSSSLGPAPTEVQPTHVLGSYVLGLCPRHSSCWFTHPQESALSKFPGHGPVG